MLNHHHRESMVIMGKYASNDARGQSFCNFIVDVYNKLSWRLDDLSPISFGVDTLIKLFVKNLEEIKT